MTKSTNGGNTWAPVIELGNAVSVRDVKVDTTHQSRHRPGGDRQRLVSLGRRRRDLQRRSDVRRAVGLEHRAHQRRLARVGAAVSAPANVGLQCGFRPPRCTSRRIAAPPGRRSRTRATSSASTAAPRSASRVPGDSVVYAYSTTVERRGRCATSTARPTADRPGSPTASTPRRCPPTPCPACTNMNICTGQCWYNQSILVDPRDAARNTVWIGGDLAVGADRDGGASWTIKTWWLYSQVPGASLRARRPSCRGLQDHRHADASSSATTAA